MWSGPRNISTALMRSWGRRSDTFVTDEPFYPHYLRQTRVDHPGAEEVTASDRRSWQEVAEWLTGPIPNGSQIWYQKQMTHHMLDGMLGDWLEELDHAFLIRDPALVIASFSKVVESPTLGDIGFERQTEIYEEITSRTGRRPPVVDSDDLLKDPEGILRSLCRALEVEFEPAMLSWEPGRRDTDGVWAKHWYASVENSSGFQPWSPREVELGPAMREVERAARPLYERLAEHRLGVGPAK